MRNLTVKRQKAYAASLATMRLYVEDPLSTELIINGIPCKKLGTLKNGEEKTFSIEEHSMKLFVIADTLSKETYNEVYTIPAGTEDVCLSGKNHLNPMAGNPFRFDGVTAEDTLRNRKKTSKKYVAIMIVALIVGLAIGFGITFIRTRTVSPETFSADGMQITLTNEFEGYEEDWAVACYYNADVTVRISRETFADYPLLEDCPLEDYGLVTIEYSELDCELENKDGLVYFEFEDTSVDGNSLYNCFIAVYKSNSAFWLVEFITDAEDAQTHRAQILEWAKSVQFTD